MYTNVIHKGLFASVLTHNPSWNYYYYSSARSAKKPFKMISVKRNKKQERGI